MNRKKLIIASLLVLCLAVAVFAQTRLRRGVASISIDDSNNVVVSPGPSATTRLQTSTTVTGRNVAYSTKTALAAGAAVTINSALGNFFTLTPAQDATINATTVGLQGQPLFVKVLTSGTSSFTLTFGANFKSTGTLATGTTTAKTFMIQFLSDGTNYVEVSRTTAQ